MSDFSTYYDAAIEVIYELEKRNYPRNEVILYIHPKTKSDMFQPSRNKLQRIDVTDREIAGCSIVESKTMPENMFIAVAVGYLQRGNADAIAFVEIDD